MSGRTCQKGETVLITLEQWARERVRDIRHSLEDTFQFEIVEAFGAVTEDKGSLKGYSENEKILEDFLVKIIMEVPPPFIHPK